MTAWRAFTKHWMVFYPLISESEKLALGYPNFMLGFLLKARFISTRSTMTPSWIHFTGAMYTIVLINLIQLQWGLLQSILWGNMTSPLLLMFHAMIGYQIRWRIYFALMWMRWYCSSPITFSSFCFAVRGIRRNLYKLAFPLFLRLVLGIRSLKELHPLSSR